ncbi:MAG: hypothetical protein AAB783_00735 [Patescibacteria group bacterium]
MKDLPTVILGTLRSDVLCESTLKEVGRRIGPDARKVLRTTPFSRRGERIPLTAISNAELGFTQDVTRLQTYEAALKLRLEIVPAEIGPGLGAIYYDQPAGEELMIGMEPLVLKGFRRIFTVEHTPATGLWLSLCKSHITLRFPPSTIWVFGKQVGIVSDDSETHRLVA